MPTLWILLRKLFADSNLSPKKLKADMTTKGPCNFRALLFVKPAPCDFLGRFFCFREGGIQLSKLRNKKAV
jgi:hypothetical protein